MVRGIWFFIKGNKTEFISLLLALLAAYFTYRTFNNPFNTLLISVTVSIIAFVIISKTRLDEKGFWFKSLQRREHKDEWLGEGKFEYSRTDESFQITDSMSGFIVPQLLIWADYRVSFDFKITNTCLGVILRAANLSNLIMLQINSDKIRPHLRINGRWIDAKEWESNFGSKLNFSVWYKCKITCDKRIIRTSIFAENKNNKFDFETTWTIPIGAAKIGIDFPIDLHYGSVGFRNYGTERALVKNFLVEKI